MRDFGEKHDVPGEISDMTLLRALGHSEFTTVGLSVSIAAIFVAPGFNLTAFVAGGKLTSMQTTGCAGITAEVTFVVGRIADFVKMKRDDSPSDQLGIGFIFFTVTGVFMLITGFVIQSTADWVKAGSKASNFDAVTVHGRGPASEANQSEP